jgi:hypothetical protein
MAVVTVTDELAVSSANEPDLASAGRDVERSVKLELLLLRAAATELRADYDHITSPHHNTTHSSQMRAERPREGRCVVHTVVAVSLAPRTFTSAIKEPAL